MSLGISAAGWAMGAAVGSVAVGAVGASKAGKAQERASDRATDAGDAQYWQTREDQLAQYDQVRADQAPYRAAGTASLAQLSQGVAPGGEYAKSFSMADFNADPGYQFRLSQGEQGISRAAAARGGAYSGATLKALSRFNSDLASQEYGAAYSRFNTDKTTKFNRNASLADRAQIANSAVGNAGNAAYGTMAQAGQNNANMRSQNIQNAGEARASGYVGASNAIGSGVKQIYNNYQQNQALNGNSFVNSNSSLGLSQPDLYSAF